MSRYGKSAGRYTSLTKMLNVLVAFSIMGMIGFAALPSLILSQKQAKMSRIPKRNPRLNKVSTAKVLKENEKMSRNDGIRSAQTTNSKTTRRGVLAVHGKGIKYGPPKKEKVSLATHQADSQDLHPASHDLARP